jgi:hypothetical protein
MVFLNFTDFGLFIKVYENFGVFCPGKAPSQDTNGFYTLHQMRTIEFFKPKEFFNGPFAL